MQEGCPLLLEKRLRLKDHEKIESSRPVGLLHLEILADLASPVLSLELPVLASLIPEAGKQAWSFRPTSIYHWLCRSPRNDRYTSEAAACCARCS